MPVEDRIDPGLVAEQKEADARTAFKGERATRDDDLRADIAAHCVD